MSGWLDYIAHANTMSRQIEAYGRLFNFVESFRTIRILEFDALAAAEFERLRRARIRIGTMDLKIAAIALANNAIPLTRNLSDFTRIPDLRAEGWSR